MSPALSILLPLYNVEEYVAKCLTTLCAQSFRDMEIIIVNDGSTDSSPDICEAFAKKDGRIKIIHQPNSGIVAARCAGIKAARGKYVWFVDSDDYIAPNAAEDVLNLIVAHDVDVLHFSVCKFDNITGRRSSFKRARLYTGRLTGEALRQKCVGFNYYQPFGGFVWNKIYRRDVLLKALPWIDIEYCNMYEDEYLSFLFLCHADSYIGMRTPPYYFYRNGTGLSTSHELTLTRFGNFCHFEKIHASLGRFLSLNELAQSMSKILDDMRIRHISAALDAYAKLGSEKDRQVARGMLIQAYSTEVIQQIMKKNRKSFLAMKKYALFSKLKPFGFHKRYARKLERLALIDVFADA